MDKSTELLLCRLQVPALRRVWLLHKALECVPLDRAIDLASMAEQLFWAHLLPKPRSKHLASGQQIRCYPKLRSRRFPPMLDPKPRLPIKSRAHVGDPNCRFRPSSVQGSLIG